MNRLALYFEDPESPELLETHFSHRLLEEEKRTIRGKTRGAFYGYGSFTWSRAVKALCLLLLNTKVNGETAKPGLLGGKGTLASSLDYSINKEPCWTHEMFGCLTNGEAFLKRLLKRSNSN